MDLLKQVANWMIWLCLPFVLSAMFSVLFQSDYLMIVQSNMFCVLYFFYFFFATLMCIIVKNMPRFL